MCQDVSLTPRFSGVALCRDASQTVLTVLPALETVETVSPGSVASYTGLKPGDNKTRSRGCLGQLPDFSSSAKLRRLPTFNQQDDYAHAN
jgi:hypothetical protein